jgi:hypothetical protein
MAAAQAGQHDPEVGEVATREPQFVVDIADDVRRGPHGRNGPQVRLEHLAPPATPAPGGAGRHTALSMTILDHATKSSRAASTSKAC